MIRTFLKTMKVPEKNERGYFYNFRMKEIFLKKSQNPRCHEEKSVIDFLYKTQDFCMTKDILNRAKDK